MAPAVGSVTVLVVLDGGPLDAGQAEFVGQGELEAGLFPQANAGDHEAALHGGVQLGALNRLDVVQ
ncbi:hypothetical protein D3C75_1189590 [compost metagenome]